MGVRNFQISKYFWFNEMVRTNHMDFFIDNRYDAVPFLFDATLFARDILDECREYFGSMSPESWFRNVELNREVGGSESSSHLRGVAIDYTKWNTWELVKENGFGLAKHLQSKGKNAKIVIESKDGKYWLHIGKADVLSVWTGINGIYEKQTLV